ncbi:hypothetical protein I552_2125 [Mycobacterium xenopi 3993]|nr:hypothetical protein I552_2125 [Mycobacterium xenopi 3993]
MMDRRRPPPRAVSPTRRRQRARRLGFPRIVKRAKGHEELPGGGHELPGGGHDIRPLTATGRADAV